MLDHSPSMTVVATVALVALLAIFVYALAHARRSTRYARHAALLPHMHSGDLAPDDLPHGEALSAKHASRRPTEDEVQAAKLGPRGVPGKPSPVKMTPQRAKKTPKHLEPGHTA
jgi:hypothetical protein